MMGALRLYFKPFCTSYSNSGQLANRIKGDESKHQLKHQILGQLTRYSPIKAHPLCIDFTFISFKDYPPHNYGIICQYILETFVFAGILQDISSGIVAEIRIHTKLTSDVTRQGCIIEFTKYEKPNRTIYYDE